MVNALEHKEFSEDLYQKIEDTYGMERREDTVSIRLQFMYAKGKTSWAEFLNNQGNKISSVDIRNLDVGESFRIIQRHAEDSGYIIKQPLSSPPGII